MEQATTIGLDIAKQAHRSSLRVGAAYTDGVFSLVTLGR
jgi:hypothetical protein